MKALDNAHKSEIKELINKWNNIIIPNFENEAALLEIELKKRHQNELEYFREAMEKEHDNSIVHYSGEIFNMKKKSEVLGQQGLYKEAKGLRKAVKQLEISCREKHDAANKEKFINRSQLLVTKHNKELKSLKKKQASQREELDQQRKKEFEIIERRFTNVWGEMETKYRKDLQKLDKDSTVKKMQMRENAMSAVKKQVGQRS